jgi:hypothetical protein
MVAIKWHVFSKTENNEKYKHIDTNKTDNNNKNI